LKTVTEFATCPVVQLGFARISSHPILGYGMAPDQAFSVLRRFLADARHRFVPDDLSCEDRILLSERISSSNHVTDYYLAALGRQHGLALATFDDALGRAFPDDPGLVELVP
jgi:predicted nucleic acid-binding protein